MVLLVQPSVSLAQQTERTIHGVALIGAEGWTSVKDDTNRCRLRNFCVSVYVNQT